MKCVEIFVLVTALLSLVPSPAVGEPALTWTGGVVGGGWDSISRGMAELIREKAGLDVKVVPGGAAQNPARVEKGEADIGMGMPPLLAAAARGEDPYTGRKMEHLRALAGNISLNVFHFYVAADLSLARLTMDEIFRARKPVRLAISRPGTADVWVFEKIMEYYALCAPGKPKDCYKTWETVGARFVRGSYAEQTVAFSDRKVDGTFAFLALPAAAVTEAAQRRKLMLLAFPQPLLDYLATFGLGEGAIPAGTYPWADNKDVDVPSATMGTTIAVSDHMPDDVAYLITRTINDNADRVRGIHESLADYDPSKAYQHLGVALHPGAERYYREHGWLP
ncbi:MAG TPA: TAXI family TRAP transporter solute-binding subunit [Candidatus Methylomirabilis sp.]|nr:TAXI family TRAP transporter solute-binding subunit [Candidatus Methylomirabilis sp.]